MKTLHFLWGLIALISIGGIVYCFTLGPTDKIAHRAPRVRTVPRFKVIEFDHISPAVPTVITHYEQPDTALRNRIVKGPVIAQVEFNRRLVTVTTIDSLGNVHGATYSLKDLRRGVIQADGTTRLERRAKRRKAIRRIAIATAAVAATITAILLAK